MVGAEPLDGGDAVGIGDDLIGEVGGWCAEVVFGCGENAPVFVIGVGGDEEASTGTADDADRATAAIEGIVRTAFIEVANDEDGTVGLMGEECHGGKEPPDVLIARCVDVWP